MVPLPQDPAATYRRVELDARVEGSDALGLTRVCLDEAIAQLRRAELAHGRGNRVACNEALARAAAGIVALQRGIDPGNPLRGPLLTLYGSAELAVRVAMADYRPGMLARVSQDLQDIRALL